jgi:hypothetical protein
MLDAELRETVHGGPVLLVGPGELEPIIALGNARGDLSAGDEDAQRHVPQGAQLVDARLQRAELFQSPA